MNFNFNETAGASQSTSLPQLEGNKVHEVTFKGCELREIIGVKDASAKYNVLDIKFANEKGYYTETIFEPKSGDEKRPETENGGKKYIKPSNIENMMLLFRHLIDTVNPELGKKIDSKEKTISANSWDGLRKLMIEATKEGIGTQTKIKLIKKKDGNPRFPYFSMIDKNTNRAVVAGNFIGDTLYFSTYEQNQISKAENATPTTQTNEFGLDSSINTTSQNNGDLDFEL
jgi:hypothetical protein